MKLKEEIKKFTDTTLSLCKKSPFWRFFAYLSLNYEMLSEDFLQIWKKDLKLVPMPINRHTRILGRSATGTFQRAFRNSGNSIVIVKSPELVYIELLKRKNGRDFYKGAGIIQDCGLSHNQQPVFNFFCFLHIGWLQPRYAQ